MDSLGGTRKQFMSVYVQMVDHIAKDKRNNLAGQMSLFDIAEESQKEEFDIRMPDVGEYPKDMLLAFEKEVLGIYVSGHPLESDQALLEQYVTNTSNDFILDDESGKAVLEDQTRVVIGGMIADKNIKYTKNDKVMAFLNLEDLVGNVEVVVFPRDYEQYGSLLTEEARVFIQGRANVEEEKDGKLLCEQIVSFEEARKANGRPIFRNRYGGGNSGNGGWQNRNNGNNQGDAGGRGQSGNGADRGQSNNGADRGNTGQNTGRRPGFPKGLWIQFPDADSYYSREQELFSDLADSDGSDDVVIYLKDAKAFRILPPDRRVKADSSLMEKLEARFGRENVKIR